MTGSHERWARELQKYSTHQIDLLTLPGRHWKWRMHGAAITLAQRFIDQGIEYDAIIASDMLDVALFRSIASLHITLPPIGTYFHENQLCYPWSPRDKDTQKGRDLHYAFINYTSALVSQRVFFNSDYHKNIFLEALPKYLDRYPDHQNKDTVTEIRAKSQTLELAMDLKALQVPTPSAKRDKQRPTLIWNHRWEYDKNPIGFFRVIDGLLDRRVDFDLALLGERFDKEPPYFLKAKERLGSRIVQYGHVESFEDYAKWLWEADIAPVTSRQDFFGGSVVEALYCGCHAFLPNRLAYPAHLDEDQKAQYLYEDENELIDTLATFIQSNQWKEPLRVPLKIESYDWVESVQTYDNELVTLSSLNQL